MINKKTRCTKCTAQSISSLPESCTIDTNGRHHSYDDKPARVFLDSKEWYYQDKLHRLHGPAIISIDDIPDNFNIIEHFWYCHGENVEEIQEDSLYIGKTIMVERPVFQKPNTHFAGIVIKQVSDLFWEALIGNKKQLIKLL